MSDPSTISLLSNASLEQRLSDLENVVGKVGSLARIRDCQSQLYKTLDKISNSDDSELNLITQILTVGADSLWNEVVAGIADASATGMVHTLSPANILSAMDAQGTTASTSSKQNTSSGKDGNRSNAGKRLPVRIHVVRSGTPNIHKAPRRRGKIGFTAADAECINAWKKKHQAQQFNWAAVIEENPHLKLRMTKKQCCWAYHSYMSLRKHRLEA